MKMDLKYESYIDLNQPQLAALRNLVNSAQSRPIPRARARARVMGS
jgi:hypothetical protein